MIATHPTCKLLPFSHAIDFLSACWRQGKGMKLVISGSRKELSTFSAVATQAIFWDMETEQNNARTRKPWSERQADQAADMEARQLFPQKLLPWPKPGAAREKEVEYDPE